MALTKISRGLLNTGVSDSSDSTFLTVDSSENATLAGNLTVSGNLTVTGTSTTVDTVTMNAQNAVIFEGATADNYETTLSIVDPTADHTQYLINQDGYIPVLAAVSTTAITSTPAELNILDGVTTTAAELNILDGVTTTAAELNLIDGGTARGTDALASGDGILINDAGTMKMTDVDTVKTFMGTTTEEIQDIVGAMFTSNTETGIAATYEDGDGTIDLVVGTLNQNTTGTAATVTTAAQTNITSLGTLTGLTTSGNIGLGTAVETWHSSYDVLQGANFSLTNDATAGASKAVTLAHNAYIDSGNDWTYINADEASYYQQYNGAHYFATAAAGSADATISFGAKMIIDSAGNVGIGATPETDWHSDWKALQVGAGTLSTLTTGAQMSLSQNARATSGSSNSSWKYIESQAAGQYVQDAGNHYFKYAGSGSADGTITWTQAMTIDSSGKVGIGTTSPSSKFHIWDGSAVDAFKMENYNRGAVWNSVGGTGMYSEYQLQGTAKFRMGQANHLVSGESTSNFAFQASSGDLIWSTSTTERMRLNNSGNVGIGTASPSGKLHVDGTSYFTNTMHMASAGNLQFVGGVYPTFIESGDTLLLKRQDTTATMVTFTSGGATVASDERLKENITTITGAITKVKQLRGVTHTWKESMQKPGDADAVSYGLIAQEVETVIPEVVHTAKVTDAEPDAWKSVSYEKLVPLLIESIKELEEKLNIREGELEQRVHEIEQRLV